QIHAGDRDPERGDHRHDRDHTRGPRAEQSACSHGRLPGHGRGWSGPNTALASSPETSKATSSRRPPIAVPATKTIGRSSSSHLASFVTNAFVASSPATSSFLKA